MLPAPDPSPPGLGCSLPGSARGKLSHTQHLERPDWRELLRRPVPRRVLRVWARESGAAGRRGRDRPRRRDSPPEKDCARTSAVKAVLGLAWWLLSSKSCSPSTLRQRPYRKLCRMSEVMTSASASPGAFSPVLSTRASAGSTEPIMGGPGLAGAGDGRTDGRAEAGMWWASGEHRGERRGL